MNYKHLFAIAILTITSTALYAGEPGRQLGRSPNYLNMAAFTPDSAKQSRNIGGAPSKPNNSSAKDSGYKKK